MIQAIKDKILIYPVKVERKGSLILTAKEDNFQVGVVVSVGEDVKYVKAKDFVWTRSYEGVPITYDDIDYISLKEDSILAFSKELR